MKITIIHGNTRHGSTWHCVDLFKQEIAELTKTEVTEFSLPKDMPHFCNGCFSCFYNGENTCPHKESMSPIISSMLEADLIVLASPVYGMDVSGQMKALLDHLCFMWMSHRPQKEMFNKLGLVVSTTAGIGLGHTAKTMKNSMKFWGVKRIFTFKKAVSAMKWEEVPEKKMAKLRKDIKKMAFEIVKKGNAINSIPYPPFRSFMFRMMSKMHKGNDWNLRDRDHWQIQGWLDGQRPF